MKYCDLLFIKDANPSNISSKKGFDAITNHIYVVSVASDKGAIWTPNTLIH
jgi:hypothetical protein